MSGNGGNTPAPIPSTIVETLSTNCSFVSLVELDADERVGAELARRPVVRAHLGRRVATGHRQRVHRELEPVAALEAPGGIVDAAGLVVEDDDGRTARTLVDPVDVPVKAHDAAVRQRDRGGIAGVAAEAERQLATMGPGNDPELGPDLLVGVEEALELPQDPPPVELPQQWPPGEPFTFGLVAVALADREEQPALGVVPRLVG